MIPNYAIGSNASGNNVALATLIDISGKDVVNTSFLPSSHQNKTIANWSYSNGETVTVDLDFDIK